MGWKKKKIRELKAKQGIPVTQIMKKLKSTYHLPESIWSDTKYKFNLAQCSPKDRINSAFENRGLGVFWKEKKTNKNLVIVSLDSVTLENSSVRAIFHNLLFEMTLLKILLEYTSLLQPYFKTEVRINRTQNFFSAYIVKHWIPN